VGISSRGGRIFLTAGSGSVRVTQKLVARTYRTAANRKSGSPRRVIDGGEVRIDASQVTLKGGINATGQNGGNGGTVVVTGDNILLTAKAMIDAGGAIGGRVLIGGEHSRRRRPCVEFLSNGNRDCANHNGSNRGPRSAADGRSGDGGKVVIWSNQKNELCGIDQCARRCDLQETAASSRSPESIC